MNIEQPYQKETFSPISWEINDEIGVFKVSENQEGNVSVEIANNKGEKISLNTLLPEGYAVIGEVARGKENSGDPGNTSWIFPEEKQLFVSKQELEHEGWKYILIFLHETGHAVKNEKHPEERKKFNLLLNKGEKDLKTLKQLEELTAKDERDAWAFAIKQFRKLTDELNLPSEKIFANTEEVKKFVNKCLVMKVESFAKDLKMPGITPEISEEKKEELLEEVSKLYIHHSGK